MQLANGKYKGNTVVPATAIAQTRLPHSILGDDRPIFNEGHFALYGLGWFLQEYCGRKVVSHTGGVNGFVTSVTLVPEDNLGIIVFTNTDQNLFYEALKWDIMDAYFNKPSRDYSKVYLGFYNSDFQGRMKHDKALMDSAAMHLKTSLPVSAYEGNYFNDVYGDMNVVQENGELKMKFSHHPNMYAKLESLGGDRFYATFTDPEFNKAIFPFHVENGKVKSVTVKVADFVEYNPYEFSRK
jgi:CubicO group peptidase (beta-lactamase class C family)